MPHLLFLAAALLPVPPIDLEHVPLIRETADKDIALPASDSVRAWTWDYLEAKPTQPVHVRLACIVMNRGGAPGSCVAAERVSPDQNTVDWAKVRLAESRAASSEDAGVVELRRTAEERLQTERVISQAKPATMFSIRFFDEVISPTDARAPYEPAETLTLGDVTLARPIDGAVVQALYPSTALRYSVQVSVVVTCRIEPTLKLLCRDRGTMGELPANVGEWAGTIRRDLTFSTFQLASTLQLEPKTKDGRAVVGRNLRLSVAWRMP